MSVSIQVTGDKHIERVFMQLERKAQNKILRKSLREAAKALLPYVQSRAPRDEGDYAKTIRVRTATRATKKREGIQKGWIGAAVKTDFKWLLKITEGSKKLFNPHWLEYGTNDTPAQPHFRPALMAGGGAVLRQFAASSKVLIEQAAMEIK